MAPPIQPNGSATEPVELAALAKLTLNDDQLRAITAKPVIFNGDNFAAFSKSVKSILKQSGQEGYLEKAIANNTPVDEKKQSRAVAFQILQWISPELRVIYEGEDRFAVTVWTELKDIYGDQVDHDHYHQVQKLSRMRISDYETRQKFLCDFQQTLLIVERADDFTLPDKMKIVLLVNALEDKFKDLVAQAPTAKSYSDFLTKLKLLVLKPNSNQPSQAAFLMNNNKNNFQQKKPPFHNNFQQRNHPNNFSNRFSNNFNSNRHQYQQPPRFQTNQFQQNRSNSNQNSNHHSGHHSNWQPQRSNQNNQYQRRNQHGYRAGHNRNFFSGDTQEFADDHQSVQHHEHRNDQHEQHQSAEFNEPPINNVQQDHHAQNRYCFCCRVLAAGCLPRTVVIHDSASSKPIFNNKDFFTNMRQLTEEERRSDGVKTGCGRVLKSTAIGQVELVTKAGIILQIDKARYIPEFEANVVPQPKRKPFNIFADDQDLLFHDKITGKLTKIGFLRDESDELYQYDLIDKQSPPSLPINRYQH